MFIECLLCPKPQAKSLGCKSEFTCNSNQLDKTPWDWYGSPHCGDEEIDVLQWEHNLSENTELIDSINLVLGVFYYSQALENFGELFVS